MLIESLFCGICRLIIIIINAHPKFLLNLGRFARYLPVDIYVPVDNLNRLAGGGYHSLDVIDFGFGGIPENDHVPSLRLCKLVNTFQNKYPVSLCHLPFVVVTDGYSPTRLEIVTTTRAPRFTRPDGHVYCRSTVCSDSIIILIISVQKIIVIPVSALAAAKSEMGALESVGHAAGWDSIGLHLKNNEDQRQRNRSDQPLKRAKNPSGPMVDRSSLSLFFRFLPYQLFLFHCRQLQNT